MHRPPGPWRRADVSCIDHGTLGLFLTYSVEACIGETREWPWGQQLLAGGQWNQSCVDRGITAKPAAHLAWGMLVRQNGIGDHKPIIARRFTAAVESGEQPYLGGVSLRRAGSRLGPTVRAGGDRPRRLRSGHVKKPPDLRRVVRDFFALLYFSGFGRPTVPIFTQTQVATVTSPLASGRRLARRCALAQLVVAGALALGFLLVSPLAALAAGLGSAALGAGTLLLGWRAFPGRAPSASEALGGLVAGLVFKILLVGFVLLLGLGVWRLPPLPLLLGVFAGLVTFAVAAAIPASSADPRSR